MKGVRAYLAVVAVSGTAISLLIAQHLGVSSPDTDPAAPGGSRSPAAALSRPLDSYGPSDADMVDIMKARKIFEIRCMNRLGFPGETFYGLTYASFDETAKSQHLSPLTLQQARHDGYHAAGDTATPSGEPSTTPTPSVAASVLHLQIAAMFGKVARVHSRAVPQEAAAHKPSETWSAAHLPSCPSIRVCSATRRKPKPTGQPS